MELKKRGLSDVVTVTLIILLAVAAVVIVWAFVRSTLEQAGEEITLTCVTANLKAVSCVAGTVVVRNEATEGTVQSVKLVYYDAADASASADGNGCTDITPFGQATCTPAPLSASTGAVKVGVAPVIDGKTCPVSPLIDCN